MAETKKQLREEFLVEQELSRVPVEAHLKRDRSALVDDSAEKTALQLYLERVYQKKIEEILLWSMSSRGIARKIIADTGKHITHTTIDNWRRQFNVIKRRVR